MESWSLIGEVVVLLGVCLLFGSICSRIRQSPLVGYLLAGMVLGGPGSFRVIQAESHIEAIAELGVSLLLFSLGLEFSWRRLSRLGGRLLAAGVTQVVVTGLLAVAGGVAWGLTSMPAAVTIAAMISLSSTAAVLRVLVDQGEIESIHGRNSLAILLVQDMAVVPLTLLLAVLSEGGTVSDVAFNISRTLGLAVALVAVLYVVLHFLAARLLLAASVERNRELTVLLAVVVGLGATWAAHAAGLSPALGAFLAGMFLGSSPFATQIRSDISSLRVVLLTLFFGAVGMVADPIWIGGHLGQVLGLAAVILCVKTVVLFGIFRVLGQGSGVALASGLCVSQVGEFSFVLGDIAKEHGLLVDEQYTLFVSSAITTLFATPYLIQFAPQAAFWLQRWTGNTLPVRDGGEVGRHPETVILGFGPAGQAVGRALVQRNRPGLVIDLNYASKVAAEAMGLVAEIGDATQLEVLEHAGLRQASVIVITLPSRSTALAALMHCRALAPSARIVVRSRYQLHQADFKSAGAHVIVGDEEQVGEGLSARVVEQLDALSTTPESVH